MRRALPLLALTLSGCVMLFAKSPTERAGRAKTCNGAKLGSFVGQPATAAVGRAILKASGAELLQWVAAGTMVTMEYRPNRVRVTLDAAGKIERASCG